MSDQTDTTDPVNNDEAEGSTNQEQTPPWGDDFDPARAWQTITHLREREKELETPAKQWERLQGDPAAQREWMEQQGYTFVEDDDEDDPPTDPDDTTDAGARDPRVDEHDQFLKQIQQERAAAQFEADLKEQLGDRDLSERGREYITMKTIADGANHDALVGAVKAWVEFEDSLKPPPAKERPKAPHVPNGGPPGDQPPAQSHQDRVQRMMDRIAAEQA